MDIEAEIMDIKQILTDLSRRIDDLLDDSVTSELMKLSEESISELSKKSGPKPARSWIGWLKKASKRTKYLWILLAA